MLLKKLSAQDRELIWHPLTQHKLHQEMLGIERAKGVYLYDLDGNEYIDAIASWYTCVYGHCNEYITERVGRQMKELDQVVFSGFTHRPAVQLAEKLLDILPENQSKLFFSDNGSTATEIGIKMALQYHHNAGQQRNVLLAFEEAFHGDTFGSMSVSGLSVYNGAFEQWMLEVERIPAPTDENIDDLISWLEARLGKKDVAGFIYEPLVQGAAAMKIHKAEHLEKILRACKKHGTITVADEVMTGFGKTGKNFASEHLQIHPDIICLSKALTAGLMPMAVTSCSQRIYDAFYSDQISKGLFHGHTYTANPLACTAALAGIDLLKSSEIQEQIQKTMEWHREFNEHIGNHPLVKNTRQCGIIFAMDLKTKADRYGNFRDRLYNYYMDHGVFLRPLGNTVYIHAPYITTRKQMEKVYQVIEGSLETLGTD